MVKISRENLGQMREKLLERITIPDACPVPPRGEKPWRPGEPPAGDPRWVK
jgi:hypothetical protein